MGSLKENIDILLRPLTPLSCLLVSQVHFRTKLFSLLCIWSIKYHLLIYQVYLAIKSCMVTLNSFLRVFGCICFVLRPSVECNKLSLCSTICVFLGYGEGQRVIVIMILLLKSYIFLVMFSSLSVFFSSLFLPSVIPCQSLILSALTLSLMILLTLYPLLAHPYHIMFPLLSLTYLL